MSATASVAAAGSEAPDTKPSLSERQRRILSYLRSNAGVKTHFKSRLIADDLDLSAKKIGVNMRPIFDGDFDVTAERWGYSSGIVWKATV